MTVYSPREDSYLLKDAVPEELEGKKALDMGTGSGIIAIEMAKKGAKVTASDINPEALEAVEKEAEGKGLEIETVESDLFEELDGKFDVITFNPPYLPGKKGIGDEEIWRGGEKGIETTERFLQQVDDHLSEDGEVYVVLSSLAEHEKLVEKFDLEIVDSESLWFERLFIAMHK